MELHDERERKNEYELQQVKFLLDIRKKFHSKSSETLRDIAQRAYRICILGGVQTQLGQGPY